MSNQLLEALTSCVNVMERDLNGLAVIQPELKQARAAIAEALRVPEPWTGEGLPPVGAVCEWKEKTGFQWVAATILFITESSVVCQRADGFEWQMLTKRTVFRPIRTPEQIDAEERAAAVEQMILVDEKGSLSRTHFCGLLYDAGFRKQVAP